MNHTDLTPGLTAGGRTLIILAQPPIPTHPGVAPLHHPPAGEEFKLLPLPFHNDPPVFHPGTLLPLPTVMAVVFVVSVYLLKPACRLLGHLDKYLPRLHPL